MSNTPFAKHLEGPIHFIGIGGIGMSALARILLDRGFKVSGSDLSSGYVTEMLVEAGAQVYKGHEASQIPQGATVIYATGVTEDNPEYCAAKLANYPLMHRSELLAAIAKDYNLLAVAGTHGKTTTSALLAHVLCVVKMGPAFAVGGLLPQYNTNGTNGKGEHFVVEACESDGTFLKYFPFGAIITNIDADHLDYYGSEEAMQKAFFKFIDSVQVPEHLFWCGDDSVLKIKQPKGISYGFNAMCQLHITHFMQDGWNNIFEFTFKGRSYSRIILPLIGRHNVLNGAAVFGLALSLGVAEEKIREAFLSFKGIKRRCERIGNFRGITFLDDYAHHPVEIQTTLQGIRQAVGCRPLIVIYQPHRYSRTRDCFGTYDDVFDAADEVILTGIYPAGELPIEGVTDEKVFKDISSSNATPITFVPKNEVAVYLHKKLDPHAVVLSIGAGDITYLGKEVIDYLEKFPPKKIRVGVLFGGRSVEHEISLVSAQNVVSGLNPEHYEIEYFGISREGMWISGKEAQQQLFHSPTVSATEPFLSTTVMKSLQACDVLFPVLHGPFGEDGTIQGFFETLGLPYVGCCQRSAAICMDKALTKELMLLHQIPTLDFISLVKFQWKNFREAIIRDILSKFSFPLFVKPVHLGSSIAVRKVQSEKELIAGIDNAFQYDTKVIVEKGIIAREIEFAVLGNECAKVFNPGEVLTNGQVYDYAAKYGVNGAATVANTDLPFDLQQQGKSLAKKAYEVVGCKGMARVDFFLDEKGQYWINEINPIPGFTSISLYPQICQANGMQLSELLDELIFLALQLAKQKASLSVNDFSLLGA